MRSLLRPPTAATVVGLKHAEAMTVMRLGSPILSPGRAQLRHMAMFAAWKDEDAIDRFLESSPLGDGWHVRLEFLRRWGKVSELDGLLPEPPDHDLDEPVVAVTLARLKLLQVPRFIKWGKPVEELVRDHPATTLALAAARPPRTVSTFSIWRTARDMEGMVHGTSDVTAPTRHSDAMVERRRKDFHFEFTTLRYRCLGEWRGNSAFVPS